MFRKIYPFSPALVQALIAASSVLQRERTALKLMLTLLVKRRDELRLGSLIPVGDLWDEIAAGDQPFSRRHAHRVRQREEAVDAKAAAAAGAGARRHLAGSAGRAGPTRSVARIFENDARLLKTLLLAALVPEVPALRALTAPRLAALNHGSVVSPVPGARARLVLQKLRSWAARVGEIRVSDDQVPIVSLQITGVDIEPILANAAHSDNDGTRRSRLQKILFEVLGIAADSIADGRAAFRAVRALLARHEAPGGPLFRGGPGTSLRAAARAPGRAGAGAWHAVRSEGAAARRSPRACPQLSTTKAPRAASSGSRPI